MMAGRARIDPSQSGARHTAEAGTLLDAPIGPVPSSRGSHDSTARFEDLVLPFIEDLVGQIESELTQYLLRQIDADRARFNQQRGNAKGDVRGEPIGSGYVGSMQARFQSPEMSS